MENHFIDIATACAQLAQAVESVLNPHISQQKRAEAYSICEEFKDKSPICIQCALYLSEHGSHLVRHFGLQLMEHCVKYKWYHIDISEKIMIKEKSLDLLDQNSAVIDHTHLKDALTRVIVEMIKREWPQHWPTLFPDLFKVAHKGPMQAEMVLLVFLRLVEDVAVLQTLESPQRRKDLYQSLTLQVETIVTFLLSIMEKHYEFTLAQECKQSVKIVQFTLLVLCEFIEWAPLTRILTDNGKVLHVLSIVISNDNFGVEAADCFLQILSRKGKYEELSLLASNLFNTDLINKCSQLNMMSDNSLSENEYLFIKKISEVLFSVSNFLCILSEKCDNSFDTILQNTISLEKFEMYLKVLINLCSLNSYYVLHNAVCAWKILFKHKTLSKVVPIVNYIPQWINYVTPKLIKVPYSAPANSTLFHEIRKYIMLDFDCEEAYIAFFYRFRSEILITYRHITNLAPHLAYSCVEQLLTSCIHNILPESYELPQEKYLEWDPLISLIEIIFLNFPENYTVSVQNGLQMIDLCLNVKTQDPVILSFLLTCISNLLFFMKHVTIETINIYLPRIIDYVFACIVFERPSAIHQARLRAVKDLRRHAGSLMVKTSVNHPHLLVPFFDNICIIYNKLKNGTNQLAKMEEVLLLEALILINNNFNNFERQSIFIKTIMSEIETYWKQACQVFNYYEQFITFIALNKDINVENYNNGCGNRMKLLYCIDAISAIINRSSCPSDKEQCVQGGFVISYEVDGTPIYCNPATPHMLPLLPGIFLLIRVLNSLWIDEVRSKLPLVYSKVFEITDFECKTLIGTVNLEKNDPWSPLEYSIHTPQHSMQNYLVNLYERSFVVLSRSCQSLGHSFYNLTNFAQSFILSAFYNINNIPDYRLRMLVKQFMKNFIIYCPTEKYDIILMPIIEHFTLHMVERLSNRWKYLIECKETGVLMDENDEQYTSKEMLENLIIIQLSREYMEIVRTMLTASRSENKSNISCLDGDESNSVSGSQSNLNVAGNIECLSDLGMKILQNETISNAVISFLLQAIIWDDSTNSYKAVSLIPIIIKQLVLNDTITSDLSTRFFVTLLQGIQVHGQHDSNLGPLLTTAVLVYEILRPKFIQLFDVLKIVPGINMEELYKFDEKILKADHKGKIDKGKKEKFKKLINELVGRNIGQLFKRKEHIRDLPRIETYRLKGNKSNISPLDGATDRLSNLNVTRNVEYLSGLCMKILQNETVSNVIISEKKLYVIKNRFVNRLKSVTSI